MKKLACVLLFPILCIAVVIFLTYAMTWFVFLCLCRFCINVMKSIYVCFVDLLGELLEQYYGAVEFINVGFGEFFDEMWK